jgi:phage shock protein PspC (stress-responsive transcriptional regulator)
MTNSVPPTPPFDQPAGQQPPPPAGAAARPELRRSSTDTMAGGVCGGLAEYSGLDAVLWRVGFVALTLAGGAGVVLYLLLWVLVPPASGGPDEVLSPLEQLVRRLHGAINGAGTTRS